MREGWVLEPTVSEPFINARTRSMCALLLVSVVCASCSGKTEPSDSVASGPRPDAMLVDMSAWVEGEEAVAPDPFGSHRPEGVALGCPIGSVVLEGAALEIRTGICAYAWLQQPLAADLQRGDPVEIVYWHSSLVSIGPAQGHFALSIGDQLLFERTVEIPADAAAYTEVFESPIAADVDEIVSFHLHNHGTNDWNFLRAERVTGE